MPYEREGGSAIRKSRFTEGQIVLVLRKAEVGIANGKKIKEICRALCRDRVGIQMSAGPVRTAAFELTTPTRAQR